MTRSHRRRGTLRPLWPRSAWSRHLVVRVVALYAALLVGVGYGDGTFGPVEVGVSVTAASVWAVLRTSAPTVMVHLVQRATSLLLLLVTAALWGRHEPWGAAAGALVLSVGAQWWVEADQRRRAAIEGRAWRARLLHELQSVRRSVATTERGMGQAVRDAVRALSQPMSAPDASPTRRGAAHRTRSRRRRTRRGAHRAHQPRARQTASEGRSEPSVESPPWPG